MLFVFLAVVVWTPLTRLLEQAEQVPLPEQAAPDLSAYPWLYLRDGEPLAASEKVVELMAVGDVMLGRGVADKSQPFVAVVPWLGAADGSTELAEVLTLGNLECVIAEEGILRPGPYRLRALPSAVTALRDAGFDVLGLANNHAFDFGPAGLAETVSRLQEAGIATVGVGPNAEAAVQPLIRQVQGVRLALLAFNAVPDPADTHGSNGWTRAGWARAQATAAIAAARDQGDGSTGLARTAVIVSVHWGYEYELRADPAQRDAAQAMLDAGADLVIGHHPHVVQGSELDPRGFRQTSGVFRDRFVAYSLGNFVFDQQQGEMRQGLALRAFFDEQGLRAVQALPVWAGPRPRLMSLDEATLLLARVQPPSSEQDELLRSGKDELPPRRLGFACNSQTCRLVNMPRTPRTGAFRTGAIDLTGDGVAEQIRLEEQQVIIYCDGIETWRGLPEWRVVDLALGDPNDDGRSELVLALWKPDATGLPRDSTGLVEVSHPFIIGYREGAYRILWGGSAVANPIREVELGDVDGDGVQELIVLEERDDGRAVTVWRWHGWGFSLMWRSPSGRYRDLVLIASGDGSPPIISVALEACGK